MGIRIDGASDLINATDGSLTVDGLSINVTGIVTASSGFQVGSAATIHSTGQINSTNIVVSAGSSIGIGTDNPDTLLHVYKSGVHGGLHANSDAPLIVENNGNCVIDIASIHTGIGGVYFSDTGASGKGKIEYKHGDDYMTFQANGSERVRISSAGGVGINTDTIGTNHNLEILGNASAYATINLKTQSLGHGSTLELGAIDDDDYGSITQFASGAGGDYVGRMRFIAGGTETMNLVGGRVLIGKTSADTDLGGALQIVGGSYAASSTLQARLTADAHAASMDLLKSRNTTWGSHTIVQDDDRLGAIYFRGDDGVNYSGAAAGIYAEIDGTPGADDLPGRIILATSADGADSPTERMRIKSDGTTEVSGAFRIKKSGDTTMNIRDTSANAVSNWITSKTAGYAEYNCYKEGVGTKYPHVFVGYTEEYARIDSAGIKFNGDTASDNGLDDYEQGSWTINPHDGSCTTTYGTYRLIGKQVTVWGRASGFSDTTTNDMIRLKGLPYSALNNWAGAAGAAMVMQVDQVVPWVAFAEDDQIRFYGSATGSFEQLRHNELNSGHEIYFCATYVIG